VQARTGSTRLPRKVLLPLAGKPLLSRLVERVRAAKLSGHVIVATTLSPTDDPVVDLCRREGFLCFRGHATDLLDRHYEAARLLRARVVVKIPSDCPLIDPAAIDRVIGHFLGNPDRFDYVSNLHPETYPDGNDVEVMSIEALETAWREAERPHEREHTTPYLWDQPERFRIGNVAWETGLDYSRRFRLALDYAEDFLVVRRVFDDLFLSDRLFGLSKIIEHLEAHPDVAQLNARFRGVNWYRHHLSELRTVSADSTVFVEEESA
jgi:spore coat polysaccharide biosynthesis protein SpsF